MTLKLGEESFTSTGKSIKKAQHSAAAEAIKLTKYPHPPEKLQRTHSSNNIKNATTRNLIIFILYLKLCLILLNILHRDQQQHYSNG